jgi:putative membrane protein
LSHLNDPRVFFAAERTLLAWTRTGITLMGFGFVIERFGLFLYMFMSIDGKEWQRDASFWVGICFILLGALVEATSVMQYRSVLKTLKPIEFPEGYWVNIGVYTNLLVATIGVAIIFYFFFGLQ